MNKVKQVICVRRDLNMGTGKIAAQVAHASMKVFLDTCIKSMDRRTYIMMAHPENPWYHWLNGPFTKIVVGYDSAEELLNLYFEACGMDIPAALITDSGKTEFHGDPITTCLAIGPYYSEEIDEITGDLSLL